MPDTTTDAATYGVKGGVPTGRTLRELERAQQIVAPAAVKAHEYAQWATGEILAGKAGETMELILQHTDLWGITQGILAEMDEINAVIATSSAKAAKSGLFSKGQSQEALDMKATAIRSIFLSKLLYEILSGTNFKEVLYGDTL